MNQKPDHRRIISALLINPLPKPVRDELLADEAFCDKLGIRPARALPLGSEHAIGLRALNGALRSALTGKKSRTLRLADGKRIAARLEAHPGGTVSIEFKGRGFNFADADLLSASKSKRARALARVFQRAPLSTSEERSWRSIAKARAFTDPEYLEIMTSLAATPEAVKEGLGGPQNLTIEKFMPDDERYYERVIAPLGDAPDIQSFVASQLATERGDLFKKCPKSALRRIGYSALWRPLVPFGLLSKVEPNEIAGLLSADDPFSLLCGFELCRALLANDTKAFTELGDLFLQKLLPYEGENKNRCHVFSGCAIIAMATIRRRAKATGRPVFWSRLAALTHAGVLCDGLGASPDAEKFFQWATENYGPTSLWHNVVDRREAPRWRVEWIHPEHLHAELIGRCHGSLHLLEERARPDSWVGGIDKALKELMASGRALTPFFPGPFDDFGEQPAANDADPVFEETMIAVQNAGQLSEARGLFALAYLVYPQDRLERQARRLLEASGTHPVADVRSELPYLDTCAYVAAVSRSEPLARTVANRCLFIARTAASRATIPDLLIIVAQACAANRSPEAYRAFLSEFSSKLIRCADGADTVEQLDAVFRTLEERDPKLIPALGQASAILRVTARAA